MKKTSIAQTVVLTAVLAAAGLGATAAQAREFGVVISATPVVEQINVPQQVCNTAQVQSTYNSGGGALIGALADDKNSPMGSWRIAADDGTAISVFEGMKHREIAAQLGISEGTSKSNFFDAKLILRKAIANSLMVAKKY